MSFERVVGLAWSVEVEGEPPSRSRAAVWGAFAVGGPAAAPASHLGCHSHRSTGTYGETVVAVVVAAASALAVAAVDTAVADIAAGRIAVVGASTAAGAAAVVVVVLAACEGGAVVADVALGRGKRLAVAVVAVVVAAERPYLGRVFGLAVVVAAAAVGGVPETLWKVACWRTRESLASRSHRPTEEGRVGEPAAALVAGAVADEVVGVNFAAAACPACLARPEAAPPLDRFRWSQLRRSTVAVRPVFALALLGPPHRNLHFSWASTSAFVEGASNAAGGPHP